MCLQAPVPSPRRRPPSAGGTAFPPRGAACAPTRAWLSEQMSSEPAQDATLQTPQQPSAPQQQEMPLAIVHGQPLLQIPQDLYIPPDALEVILDAFEGPLDLLLYLIR